MQEQCTRLHGGGGGFCALAPGLLALAGSWGMQLTQKLSLDNAELTAHEVYILVR